MEYHFGHYFGNPRKYYGEQNFYDTNSKCGQFRPYRKFSAGKMEHVRFPKPNQTRRCSPSLLQTQKVNRDRARMTAFILRKTAESLPFGSLDNNELVKLGTNHSLQCAKPKISIITTCVSTQTSSEAVSCIIDHSDYEKLKMENEILLQENVKLENLKLDNLTLRQEIQKYGYIQIENDTLKSKLNAQQIQESEKSTLILELIGHKRQLEVNFRNLESALNEANVCNDELQEDLQNCEYNLSCAQAEISSLHSMHSCQPTYTQDYYNSQECYTYDQPDQHQGFKPKGRRPRRGR